MRLADFVEARAEQIADEWEQFASRMSPAADAMSPLQLRDHVVPILRAMAADLRTQQTPDAQRLKAQGQAPRLPGAPETAAQTHGTLRAMSGFDPKQLLSEFRALRACVLRLWMDDLGDERAATDDLVRFNEAVDQAAAESLEFYVSRVEWTRNIFFAGLGHDMRTPLQSIGMAAAVVGKATGGTTAAEALALIGRSVAQISVIVENLVEFSSLTLRSDDRLELRPTDVGAIVREEAAVCQTAYPGTPIELDVPAGLRASWDVGRAQRLLGNLIVNGIKHGAPGQPLRIAVVGTPADIVVEVRNRGSPIGPEDAEQLFEPLRRGPPPGQHRDRRAGLGLGLYIARQVARLHGGDVALRCEDGEVVAVARLLRRPAGTRRG